MELLIKRRLTDRGTRRLLADVDEKYQFVSINEETNKQIASYEDEIDKTYFVLRGISKELIVLDMLYQMTVTKKKKEREELFDQIKDSFVPLPGDSPPLNISNAPNMNASLQHRKSLVEQKKLLNDTIIQLRNKISETNRNKKEEESEVLINNAMFNRNLSKLLRKKKGARPETVAKINQEIQILYAASKRLFPGFDKIPALEEVSKFDVTDTDTSKKLLIAYNELLKKAKETAITYNYEIKKKSMLEKYPLGSVVLYYDVLDETHVYDSCEQINEKDSVISISGKKIAKKNIIKCYPIGQKIDYYRNNYPDKIIKAMEREYLDKISDQHTLQNSKNKLDIELRKTTSRNVEKIRNQITVISNLMVKNTEDIQKLENIFIFYNTFVDSNWTDRSQILNLREKTVTDTNLVKSVVIYTNTMYEATLKELGIFYYKSNNNKNIAPSKIVSVKSRGVLNKEDSDLRVENERNKLNKIQSSITKLEEMIDTNFMTIKTIYYIFISTFEINDPPSGLKLVSSIISDFEKMISQDNVLDYSNINSLKLLVAAAIIYTKVSVVTAQSIANYLNTIPFHSIFDPKMTFSIFNKDTNKTTQHVFTPSDIIINTVLLLSEYLKS